MLPLMLHSWPRAVLHVDCDAFFVSVEQSINPEFKGKPVVTGAERGIVSALSYEAKAKGVKRGMSLSEVNAICPKCIMLPSDYETYSIFSERLFSILRRFTPDVEEYSIDEAFCDLTGLRRLHRCSYVEIASVIQKTIQDELGITVSVGVSLSKSLSKICSKLKKPAGLVAVPGKRIHILLKNIDVKDIWGIGPNTTALLNKHYIKTALDFIERPKSFIEKLMGKVGAEIWMELRGEYVYKINKEPKKSYASISKAKTFSPSSSDESFVFAQALRNLESAFIKARRYNLATKKIKLYLKQQDFETDGMEINLTRPTNSPIDIACILKNAFDGIFKKGVVYRATNIVLSNLVSENIAQFDLFDNQIKIEGLKKLSNAIDEINSKFGKHTIFLSRGIEIQNKKLHPRNEKAPRKINLLQGETLRQRLGIPLLSYRMS